MSQEVFENYLEDLIEKNIKLQKFKDICKKINKVVSKHNIKLNNTIENLEFVDKSTKQKLFDIKLEVEDLDFKYDFDKYIDKLNKVEYSITNGTHPEWAKINLEKNIKKARDEKSKKLEI